MTHKIGVVIKLHLRSECEIRTCGKYFSNKNIVCFAKTTILIAKHLDLKNGTLQLDF